MIDEPRLYRVKVTTEWSAEVDALVWASEEGTARRLAQQMVEVDIEDACLDSHWSVAKPEPLDDGVLDRMDDDDLWLILPDGEVCDNDRAGLAKFQALFDFERLEALRLAAIERSNGQLALLEAEQ
jgi:hypothetical protein